MLLVLSLVAQHVHRFGGLYLASDDSYIYLGYAKRALEAPRELFSYNPGERSAGTTGLLYYYALVATSYVTRAFTFAWPLHVTLRLSSYVLAGGLTVVSSLLYWATWRRLDAGEKRAPRFTFVLAMALFFANARFIWGLFAGLESPLSAALVLALAHAFVRRAAPWRTGALGGLLIATRPDLASVLWLVPAATAVLPSPDRRVAWWRPFSESASALAAAVVVLVGPCYFLTGRLFPSALDTRIRVAALREPDLLLAGIRDALSVESFVKTDWQVMASPR